MRCIKNSSSVLMNSPQALLKMEQDMAVKVDLFQQITQKHQEAVEAVVIYLRNEAEVQSKWKGNVEGWATTKNAEVVNLHQRSDLKENRVAQLEASLRAERAKVRDVEERLAEERALNRELEKSSHAGSFSQEFTDAPAAPDHHSGRAQRTPYLPRGQ